MRVFIVNSVCGSGSTGRIVTDIAKKLLEKGNTVKIAFGVGEASNIDLKYTVKINNKLGYYVHNALSKITDRAGFYSTYSTKKLIKEIEEFSPDLIHLHNLHGYYLNIKSLFEYLSKLNIPIVWTIHDCWPITGHCTHFSYERCDKWMLNCDRCPLKKEYPTSYGLDQSHKNYVQKKTLFCSLKNLTIVTPSNWLASIVKKSFLAKYQVYPVPNGIDLDVFLPKKKNVIKQKLNIGNSKMLLAVSNVWYEKKGIYDLFKLSSLLDANKYKLVIIGLNESDFKNIPDNIIAIKRTDNIEELVDYYSEADLFLNLSYEETMGMVTAEALACGTPAIVYDQTAVPEIVDKTCGVIVKAGDLEELLDVINKFDFSKDWQCRKRCELYEKNAQYNKHLKLYEYLIRNV